MMYLTSVIYFSIVEIFKRNIQFGLTVEVPVKKLPRGSGCGSVGRAVASDARGPRFESSHCQTFITDNYLFIYCQLY